MTGTLYLVATPIGNLEDVSTRALRTLKEVSLVLAEDTRVTKKLLSHFDIHTPTQSFHEYSDHAKIEKILDRLAGGESIALVTDAGTPGVSDPGAYLVSEAVRRFGDEAKTFAIPGPSAVTAALSVSGFPGDAFTFLGFLPAKKGRQGAITDAISRKETLVLFESPHRIAKTLTELAAKAPERRAVVIREISKVFETLHRGTLSELAAPEKVRAQGEFVIVLAPIK